MKKLLNEKKEERNQKLRIIVQTNAVAEMKLPKEKQVCMASGVYRNVTFDEFNKLKKTS